MEKELGKSLNIKEVQERLKVHLISLFKMELF
jgi:hypothetical protein